MKFNIAILEGDGIGPEVVRQAQLVLSSIALKYGHKFDFHYGSIGADSIDKYGAALTQETIQLCKNCDAVLLGAIGDPKYDHDPNSTVRPEQGLLQLRKELGLYCNIRPIRPYTSLNHLSNLKPKVLESVDMVIYRELTGGIYFGKKTKTKNTASDLCIYSDYEIERISRLAFSAAMQRRNKLCLVDKANVLESSRLWRRVVQNIAGEYPSVELTYLYIDNAAMQLILNPAQFDVVLTSNMFGDIMSDEASVLSGSLGLLPSASIGEDGKLYEPVHGSFPQAAGKDIANPMATILSAAMMLRDLNLIAEAEEIEQAVESTIDAKVLTSELTPEHAYSCSAVGKFIAEVVEFGPSYARQKLTNTLAV